MVPRTASDNSAVDEEIIELTDVIEKGKVKKTPEVDVSMGGEDVDMSFEQELEDLFSDADDLPQAKPSGKTSSVKDDGESDDLDEAFGDLFDEDDQADGASTGGDELDFSLEATDAGDTDEDFDLGLDDDAPSPRQEAAPSGQDDIDDLFADLDAELGADDVSDSAPEKERKAEKSDQNGIDDLLGDLGDLDFESDEQDAPAKPEKAKKEAPSKKAAKKDLPESAGQDEIDDLLGDFDLGDEDVLGGEAEDAAPEEEAPVAKKAAKAPEPPQAPDEGELDLGDLDGLDDLDLTETPEKPAAQDRPQKAPRQKEKPAAKESPAQAASQDDIDDMLGDMDLGDLGLGDDDSDTFGEDLLNQLDSDDDLPPHEAGAASEEEVEFEVLEEEKKPRSKAAPPAEPDEPEGFDDDLAEILRDVTEDEPAAGTDDFDLDSLEQELGLESQEGEAQPPAKEGKKARSRQDAPSDAGEAADDGLGELDLSDFDLDEPTLSGDAVAKAQDGQFEQDVQELDFGDLAEQVGDEDTELIADVTQEIDLTPGDVEDTTQDRGEEIDLEGLDDLIDGLDLPEEGSDSDAAVMDDEVTELLGAEPDAPAGQAEGPSAAPPEVELGALESDELDEQDLRLDEQDLEDLDAIIQDIDDEQVDQPDEEDEVESQRPDEDTDLEIGEQDLDAIESALNEEELQDFDEEELTAPQEGEETEVAVQAEEDTLTDFELAEEELEDDLLPSDLDLESMDELEFEEKIEQAELLEQSARQPQEHAAPAPEAVALADAGPDRETLDRMQQELESLRARFQELQTRVEDLGQAEVPAPEPLDEEAIAASVDKALQGPVEDVRRELRESLASAVAEALEAALPREREEISATVLEQARENLDARLEERLSDLAGEGLPGLAETMERRLAEIVAEDSPLLEKIKELLAPEIENIVHEGLLPFRSEALNETRLEERLRVFGSDLEERLGERIEQRVGERLAKEVPLAAARIIREEIAALATELS